MLIDELELESWLSEAGYRNGANHTPVRRSPGSTYIRIPNRMSAGGSGNMRPLKLRMVRVDSAKEREEVVAA